MIEFNATELGTEDLITPQDMVVTLSHSGYIKSQPLTASCTAFTSASPGNMSGSSCLNISVQDGTSVMMASVTIAQDEVLERVEHGVLHRLHVGVSGEHERQLLLEHQRAGRHECHDGVQYVIEQLIVLF